MRAPSQKDLVPASDLSYICLRIFIDSKLVCQDEKGRIFVFSIAVLSGYGTHGLIRCCVRDCSKSQVFAEKSRKNWPLTGLLEQSLSSTDAVFWRANSRISREKRGSALDCRTAKAIAGVQKRRAARKSPRKPVFRWSKKLHQSS